MTQTRRQSQQEQGQEPQRNGPPAGWRYYSQAKHRTRFRGWIAQVWRGAKNNAALVSAFLALLGVLLTVLINSSLAQQEQARQQRLENYRAQRELELAEQRTQDEVLQTYLDQMGSLLLEKDLRSSEEGSEVRTLARTRTLTVLEALDPSRKTAVMQFLVESELVQAVPHHPTLGRGPIISLAGADLSGADLSNADLRGADLSNADLSDADLSDTVSVRARPRVADLSNADLSDADLSGADLRGVRGVTEEQLEKQTPFLKGATMPDGSIHD